MPKNFSFLSNSEWVIIISLILGFVNSNSQLTYEDTTEEYKTIFNNTILKQVNHLINEINRSEKVDDKMIGCTAIILTGLSYNHKKFLSYGLNLLKKDRKSVV